MGEQNLEKICRKFVHDIRTPISVLNMLTSLFESGQVSADDLKIMKEELGKMEKLVTEHSQNMKKFYIKEAEHAK